MFPNLKLGLYLSFLLMTQTLWAQGLHCNAYLGGPTLNSMVKPHGLPDDLKDYLIDLKGIDFSSQGLSITQKVKTPFGEVILRTKDLQELAAKVLNFGTSEDMMALYVNDIFSRRQKPSFIDPDFLNWVISSFELAIKTYYIDFTDPNSGYTPNGYTQGDFDLIQRAGASKIKTQAREQLMTSPVRFYTNFGDLSSPTDWLHDFEPIWLFRIFIREPTVRKILSYFQSLKHLSPTEFDDVVFMISAYPELLRLAGSLDKIGFKPGTYFLTDGHYTESGLVNFGQDLKSRLILAKHFVDSEETSYAFISIDGDAFYEMSFDDNEAFRKHVQKVWQSFKDQHKKLFKHVTTEINIELDQDFRIELDPDEPNGTEIIALFYIQLLDQLRSLKFSR